MIIFTGNDVFQMKKSVEAANFRLALDQAQATRDSLEKITIEQIRVTSIVEQ